MPTYEVVSGDTVWGLSRRALTEQLGRVPTNREILEVVNQVQVPSGNVDLIYPGEQIVIPVGPGYGPGATPPGAGNGPGDFVVPPSAPGILGGVGGTGKDTDEFRRFRELERESYGQNPVESAAANQFLNQPSGPGAAPAPVDPRRFNPRPFSAESWRSLTGQPLQEEYRTLDWRSPSDWAAATREAFTDILPFLPVSRAPGVGSAVRPALPAAPVRPSLPVGPSGAARPMLPTGPVRPTIPTGPVGPRPLPSGQLPALPAGPAGGYPAAGGGTMPFQFGPRPPLPSQGWTSRYFGSGGYTY